MKIYKPYIIKIILSVMAVILGVIISFSAAINPIFVIIGTALFIICVFLAFENNKIEIENGKMKITSTDNNGSENIIEIDMTDITAFKFDGNYLILETSNGLRSKIVMGWYSNRQISELINKIECANIK
jgi:hypothetical protein